MKDYTTDDLHKEFAEENLLSFCLWVYKNFHEYDGRLYRRQELDIISEEQDMMEAKVTGAIN